MNKEQFIKQYEEACEKIAIFFANKYFGDDYEYIYTDWVGCEIGGTIQINDYWFKLEQMLHFLKYKYTKKEMFEYYEYHLNEGEVCIRDWKKLKKGGII